jgi:ABC-type multidrug transport system fused ATPase/permease subunit
VEVATVQGAVLQVRALAQLAPLALALIFLSSPVSLLTAALFVPLAWLLGRLRRRWRGAHESALATLERLEQETDELIGNLDLFRVYGRGERVVSLLRASSERASRTAARVEAWRAALSGSNEVIGALALLGAVGLATKLGVELSAGLVAAVPVVLLAYRPVRDWGDARSWCARGAHATSSLAMLVHIAEPESGPQSRSQRYRTVEPLELRDFGAHARGPRTSFAVAPGEMVCIVGPTGSGKTTLLRGLLGLEAVTGTVRYGSANLTGGGVGPEHRPFAWVPQEAPLVTGSVLDNVAMFARDPAAAAAIVDELGLGASRDDQVGPGARPLSGGERRLVAIGRALLSELPVLLLDEPTEGLDAEAESKVLEVLFRIRSRRSILLVTHRPEVARRADRIVRIGSDARQASGSELRQEPRVVLEQ